MICWMLENNLQLLEHIKEKKPEQAPSSSWWIIAAAVEPVAAAINTTFVILQSRELILSQQRVEVDSLVVRLCSMLNIGMVGSNEEYHTMAATEYHLFSRWWIRIISVIEHIHDQGSFARDLLTSLPDDEWSHVLCHVMRYAIHIVDGLSVVQAERECNNSAAFDEAPPVMPAELVKLRTGHFIDKILEPYRNHIRQFWSLADVQEI